MVFSTPSRLPSSCTSPETAFTNGALSGVMISVKLAFSACRSLVSEIFQAPRSWVQNSYPTLMYYNKPDRGGHFAAWEEPELFASEVRAAFRSLR